MSLCIIEKKKIEIIVSDSYDMEHAFYRGEDEMQAEKISACLEMVVEIVESFPNSGTDDVRNVWEILECNGHTP